MLSLTQQGILFNYLQQKNERFIWSHCPMLPIQYFISKKFKNWNLKASFSALTFSVSLGVVTRPCRGSQPQEQKYQVLLHALLVPQATEGCTLPHACFSKQKRRFTAPRGFQLGNGCAIDPAIKPVGKCALLPLNSSLASIKLQKYPGFLPVPLLFSFILSFTFSMIFVHFSC